MVVHHSLQLRLSGLHVKEGACRCSRIFAVDEAAQSDAGSLVRKSCRSECQCSLKFKVLN